MCDYNTGLKYDLGIRESDRKNNKVNRCASNF